MPYSEIAKLKSSERIKKILDIVLENKIVVLQGKLEPVEEISLIQSTMALVGRIKKFKGVEIATLNPGESNNFLSKFKNALAKALIGSTSGITIIGPAAIIKEIKKDPSKVELMLKK